MDARGLSLVAASEGYALVAVLGLLTGKNTRVGNHSLLQGIVPTQGSSTGLLHCRWILYHLSQQRSPRIDTITFIITAKSLTVETIEISINSRIDEYHQKESYSAVKMNELQPPEKCG